MSETRTIPLTRGFVAIVDAEDYDRLSQFKWQARRGSHTWYAKRVITCDGRRVTIPMAGEILNVRTSIRTPIDHINGDGLDNRKANLRRCSISQNCMNRRRVDGCAVPFRGVRIRRGRYQARIKLHQKTTYLGEFSDPVLAARAYDEAARRLHGEFAVLNFPTP